MLSRSCFLIFLFLPLLALSQNTFPSSGNVGIGTTSPSSRLELANLGSNNGILFDMTRLNDKTLQIINNFLIYNKENKKNLDLEESKRNILKNDIE